MMEKLSKVSHPLFVCPSLTPAHNKRKEKRYQNHTAKMPASKRNLRMAPASVKPHVGPWRPVRRPCQGRGCEDISYKARTGDTVWTEVSASEKQEEKHGQRKKDLWSQAGDSPPGSGSLPLKTKGQLSMRYRARELCTQPAWVPLATPPG